MKLRQRVYLQIANGGKLLLFGSADPNQYESLPERRYVRSIHTLALVCDEDELRRRLISRPVWRGSSREEIIATMIQFNRSLRALAEREPHAITVVDTTCDAADVSAAHVAAWARKVLRQDEAVD